MTKEIAKRDPPAFQEYASDMLANRWYRQMSFAERGLLDTLRRELWVNEAIPADTSKLAAYLGKPVAEIATLLPAVMAFFEVVGDDIRCPELDNQKARMERTRVAKSEGGKKGMNNRWNGEKPDQ